MKLLLKFRDKRYNFQASLVFIALIFPIFYLQHYAIIFLSSSYCSFSSLSSHKYFTKLFLFSAQKNYSSRKKVLQEGNNQVWVVVYFVSTSVFLPHTIIVWFVKSYQILIIAVGIIYILNNSLGYYLYYTILYYTIE